MLWQLTLTRIIQVFVVQGIVAFIFLYLAILILKRDTKRLNVIFSGFYLCAVIGLFINMIYANLTNETAVLWLNFMTNYLFALCGIFLVIFDLILLKSEKVINTRKQLQILIAYGGILLLGMVFLLLLPEPGVTINASTNWKPVYTLPFYIFLMIVIIGGTLFPSLYFASKIYQQFDDEILKKKWRFFMLGLIIMYIFMIGTFTMNIINNDDIRTLWSLVSLATSTSGPILIYIGVGKQIER